MPKAKKPAKKPAPKTKAAKPAKPAKKAASVKVKDLSLEGGKKGGKGADVRGGDGALLPGAQVTSRDLQVTRTPIRELGSGGSAQTMYCQPALTSAGAQSLDGGQMNTAPTR